MCVLWVSFGSKVRPRTFGCVAMGIVVLFILRSRFPLYSAWSGVNRVQVVDLVRYVLSRQKRYVGMMEEFLGCSRVYVDVMVSLYCRY